MRTTLSLTLSLTHTLTLSHSHSLTHTLTLSLTHSLTVRHSSPPACPRTYQSHSTACLLVAGRVLDEVGRVLGVTLLELLVQGMATPGVVVGVDEEQLQRARQSGEKRNLGRGTMAC